MTEEISTRRAIEVVMSRLRLNEYTRNDLACALYNEIRNPAEPPTDIDSSRADLHRALADLRVDKSFKKDALLSRIDSARAQIRRALGAK